MVVLKTFENEDTQAEVAARNSQAAPLRLTADCSGAGLAHQLRRPQDTPENELRVGAFGQDVQKIGSSHKVEAREGNSLGLQIVLCTKAAASATCQGQHWQVVFCNVQAGAYELNHMYRHNTASA